MSNCVSGKLQYPNAAEAFRVFSAHNPKHKKRGMRAYKCQHCHLWHLTSKSKN